MLFTIFLLSLSAFAETLMVSEKSLIQLAQESSPRLSEIRSQLLLSMEDRSVLNERYAPELFAKGSYSETQERPIISFLPIFSPVKTAQLGVRQKFSKGFDAQMALVADQRSANSPVAGQYKDVTTNILSLTVQMDIWKDLFGALSESSLKRNDLTVSRSKIEEEINKKALQISVRRIYWNLVANAEQSLISGRLMDDAREQLGDSKRRLAKSIGDEGPRFLESCPVEVKSIIYRDSYNLGAARAEKKSFP
ncbi:MAG TPA: hypothetical protein VNJ08_04690 [Bacteriovoracaceae bacterium]|nr:hypothetical protein [Bacteriovoracaceae bacterium]